MKINQEKLSEVVDLYMNKIIREEKDCKECDQMMEDFELNELDELLEDEENVDEQIASKGMLMAKAAADKAAKLRQAANAGTNMAARGGDGASRAAAIIRR